jgi:signal transduction histidine kinase
MAMGSTLDRDELLDLILRLTTEELQADQASILLLDEDSDQLRMLAALGLPRQVVEQGYIPRKGSIAEWVIKNDEPLILNDIASDARFTSVATSRAIRSAMCVPLRAKGKVIGTLNISRRYNGEFGESDLHKMVILATQAAVSIENARLLERNLQAQRMAMIGEMAAGISHCTRNMLTGLKGGAGIIEIGIQKQDWSYAQKGLGMVRRNTDHIANLVLDMLDYSKDRKPDGRLFELDRLIDEIIHDLACSLEGQPIQLAARIDPSCRRIHGDSDQIHRALLNLAGNAVDAILLGPGEGRIEIVAERLAADSPLLRKCRPADGNRAFCAVHVRDTGGGIPAEHVGRIFESFFSSKGSRGTGLGLPVSRKIAREHGGDLVFETLPDKGSTFSLILPAPAVAPDEPEDPAPDELPSEELASECNSSARAASEIS